jgi:DNA-binding MarR family transcriptional regulator
MRGSSRAVTQLYDLVLSPTGLKTTQFMILRAIHEAGEVAQCSFARDHAIAVETLSRRFGSLRKKGYVQVRLGGRHCERIYTLTDKGRRAMADALPYWDRAQRRLRTALGEADWQTMLALADRISEAAAAAAQQQTNNKVREILAPCGEHDSGLASPGDKASETKSRVA